MTDSPKRLPGRARRTRSTLKERPDRWTGVILNVAAALSAAQVLLDELRVLLKL